MFCSPYAAKITLKVCKSLSYVKKVILFDGKKLDNFAISFNDFKKLAEKSDFDVEANVAQKVDIKDQVSLLVCSSGTTGMPKGVMITQMNMMSVIQGYRDLFVITKMMTGKSNCIFNIAPWFHALGFMSMFLVACSRDSIFVFLPKFEEKAFLSSIEVSFSVSFDAVSNLLSLTLQKYKVNTITVVPPVMVMLAKSPLFDKYDLSSIMSKNADEQRHRKLS